MLLRMVAGCVVIALIAVAATALGAAAFGSLVVEACLVIIRGFYMEPAEPNQLYLLAAIAVILLGCALAWLWRSSLWTTLKVREASGGVVDRIKWLTAVGILEVGLLSLWPIVQAPGWKAMWGVQGRLTFIAGVIAVAPLAISLLGWVVTKLGLNSQLLDEGDARAMPVHVIGLLRRQKLLPAEPFWGHVGGLSISEDLEPSTSRSRFDIALRGWLVGADALTVFYLNKSSHADDPVKWMSPYGWSVSGDRIDFTEVMVWHRSFPCTRTPRLPDTSQKVTLQTSGLPTSVITKVSSVQGTLFSDAHLSPSRLGFSMLVTAISADDDELVAIHAGLEDGKRREQSARWTVTLIRASLSDAKLELRTGGLSESVWSDLDSYTPGKPVHAYWNRSPGM